MPHQYFSGKVQELIARANQGTGEDVDYILGHLDGDVTLSVTRFVDYALSLVDREEGVERITFYLFNGNVANKGLISNLPQDACVEVPVWASRKGLEAVPVGSLPPQLAGMSRLHLAVQELTVKAALEGRRDYVHQAVMLDPLVAAILPLDQIWAMVDELIAAHGSAMPVVGATFVSSSVAQSSMPKAENSWHSRP